jgi:hypothetical protein
MFRTTLAMLIVVAAAAIGVQAAGARTDPWYGYAVSYSNPGFVTDTLAPGGHSSAPVQRYRFISDTLAPGGGTLAVQAPPSASSFSWGDAGIIAAGAAGITLVVLVGAWAVASRRHRVLAA